MSKYYTAQRTARLFIPGASEPFRLSRSKLDMFIKCARCFYLDLRLGVGQPPSFPLTLNIAVDELLKKEFDVHRATKTPHPFMAAYKIDAIPLDHPDMEKWRDSLKRGVEYVHPETNLSLRGGVDDVWVNKKGEFIVVDYKATSKREEPTLDGDLGDQYKRQMEIYQWLLQKNGHKVAKVGYFVYVNGNKDAEAFDKKLEFTVSVIPCEGDTDWVHDALMRAHACLMANVLPQKGSECDFCAYREAALNAVVRHQKEYKK